MQGAVRVSNSGAAPGKQPSQLFSVVIREGSLSARTYIDWIMGFPVKKWCVL